MKSGLRQSSAAVFLPSSMAMDMKLVGMGGCDWRMVMAMHQPQDKIISTANKSLKGIKIEWEHDGRTDGL